MLHRQALAFRNVCEELQTAFQTVIRFVNYVKSNPMVQESHEWGSIPGRDIEGIFFS
jgi:hypothetical protein